MALISSWRPKADKRINKLLKRHKEGNGRESTIFRYNFLDERSPEFYLVVIPNREYDLRKRSGPGNKEFLLFVTRIAFDSPKEFVKRVPPELSSKMEDRGRLSGEEGIQDTNVFTVVRRPGVLLRGTMPHVRFLAPLEANSSHRRASTEGTDRGRPQALPAAWQILQKALVTGILREDSALQSAENAGTPGSVS